MEMAPQARQVSTCFYAAKRAFLGFQPKTANSGRLWRGFRREGSLSGAGKSAFVAASLDLATT